MSGFPLPDIIYQNSLIPKDSPLQIQIFNFEETTASTVIVQDYTVPGYSDFIIMSATQNHLAGAAQSFLKCYFGLQPPVQGSIVWLDSNDHIDFARVAATEYVEPFHNIHGLYVPRLWTVRCLTSFSAGAAGNRVRFNIAGFLIPPVFA